MRPRRTLWERLDRARVASVLLGAVYLVLGTVGLWLTLGAAYAFILMADYPYPSGHGSAIARASGPLTLTFLGVFALVAASAALFYATGLGTLAGRGAEPASPPAEPPPVDASDPRKPAEGSLSSLSQVLIILVLVALGPVSVVPLCALAELVLVIVTESTRGQVDPIVLLVLGAEAALGASAWMWVASKLDAETMLRRAGAVPASAQGRARTAVRKAQLAATDRACVHVWVLESHAVNAFVMTSGDGHGHAVFTSACLDVMDPDELTAVAATLVARVTTGAARVAQLTGVLFGPLLVLERAWGGVSQSVRSGSMDPAAAIAIWVLLLQGAGSPAFLFWIPALFGAWAVLSGTGILSDERIDSEALLLTKDPEPFASAIRKASAHPHGLPRIQIGFGPLFFVWPRNTWRAARLARVRVEAIERSALEPVRSARPSG